MSAEVILMNKTGIAIAADSAVTIGDRTKIYNTADKMFMLSKYAPIGILIYNSSALMDIPLELIIKQYREVLNDKKFDYLKDYEKDFVEFCTKFISDNVEEEKEIQFINAQLLRNCSTIFQTVNQKLFNELSQGEPKTSEEILHLMNENMQNIVNSINIENKNLFSDDNFAQIEVKLDTLKVIELCEQQYNFVLLDEIKENLKGKLHELIRCYDYWDKSSFTGMAITGYGEKEIFPSCIQIECLGILDKKVLKIREQEYIVNFKQHAQIIPLAQTDVMNEFFIGVNDEIEKEYNYIINQRIQKETNDEFKKELLELGEELNSKKIKIINTRRNGIYNSLSFLPRDEMIYMAEGMINMTSFKRRLIVDDYSETVGGPIDIAFISKGDGFIWIKRKKYFEKDLNYVFTENYFKKKGE